MYRLYTNGGNFTGIVDSDVTTCSVLIKASGGTKCAVSVAAVNQASVGDHSPPVEVQIPDSRMEISRRPDLDESVLEQVAKEVTKSKRVTHL